MKLTCKNCNKEYELSQEDESFIQKAKRNNMTFAILNCKLCGSSFPINPQHIEKPFIKDEVENQFLRCPTQGCYGFVVKINDIYGCGECGNVWNNMHEVYTDISKIIKKYPYRKNVYIQDNNAYTPVDDDKEPDNYEDLVRQELFS